MFEVVAWAVCQSGGFVSPICPTSQGANCRLDLVYGTKTSVCIAQRANSQSQRLDRVDLAWQCPSENLVEAPVLFYIKE